MIDREYANRLNAMKANKSMTQNRKVIRMPDEYPLWRNYRLWELDNSNCKLITGMDYDELRRYASAFTTAGNDENMDDPMWDVVMNMDARKVWEARQRYKKGSV